MRIPITWRLKNQRYKLEGSVCPQCGEKYFPPRDVCPACKAHPLQPYRFNGNGIIYSFTVIYQATPRFEPYVPYVVALVKLEEGPMITAQITDIDVDSVSIGMPVEMVFRKISEQGERGLIYYGYKFRPVLED